MKRTLNVVLVVAAFFSMTALAQMNRSTTQGGMAMKSMVELERLSGKPFDIAYMSQMIEHHRGAVEMAQACVKNCKRVEVKKSAQAIINAQSAEIRTLEGWLKAWYNTKPDAKQMAMMRSDMKAMMDHSISGMTPMQGMEMPVDRSFLEGMVPHHQDAVGMSELALKKAARAELKKFAQGVIAAQTKEVKQLQAWLKGL